MIADLSFAALDQALPDGAIVEDVPNNDVKISLKVLMNEANVALGDSKVSEAVSKLLDACAKAQVAFNTASPVDLNSYPFPTPGIPTQDSDGNWFATFTHTVSVTIPLNRDQTSGVVL